MVWIDTPRLPADADEVVVSKCPQKLTGAVPKNNVPLDLIFVHIPTFAELPEAENRTRVSRLREVGRAT